MNTRRKRLSSGAVALLTERVVTELRAADMQAAADRVENGRPATVSALVDLIGGQADQLSRFLQEDLGLDAATGGAL